MIQWQDVKLPTDWLLEQETSLAKSTTNKWSNNTYSIYRWNYVFIGRKEEQGERHIYKENFGFSIRDIPPYIGRKSIF